MKLVVGCFKHWRALAHSNRCVLFDESCMHSGYNVYICISYSLAYLKYLFKYVNTYACQNYLHKIVVIRIFVSGWRSWICRAQLSSINSFDIDIFDICGNICGQHILLGGVGHCCAWHVRVPFGNVLFLISNN